LAGIKSRPAPNCIRKWWNEPGPSTEKPTGCWQALNYP